ncbi:c-type cytochrome [Haloferula chungangensis]|uniref:C-type cytochrome n=1 Tax=Haloferula chungangensis TaxID=1048331 RepID=A0ABW2L4L4_9BACT
MPRVIHPFLFAIALTAKPCLHAQEVAAGKTAYEVNCMACHQIDAHTVGPSLIRIASVYPKDKRATFIHWAKNPGKKDPLAVEMPSMAHLPDETLANIHDFILKVVVGKREKKGSPMFANYKEPKRELPYVVHTFMPDSSPASIVVALPDGLALCWDTAICQFRYAWKGDHTAARGSRKIAGLRAKPFIRATTENFFTKLGNTTPDYRGYRLVEGYPEFDYSMGGVEIRELVRKARHAQAIERHFTTTGATNGLVLDLTHEGPGRITCDKGSIRDNKLTLTPAEAAAFTLTISNTSEK